ncbi:MAG: hypothetical protein JXB10_16905 [Pirellulales bacterium]|nr:hypothetical protein [Pirellulales bacterium]
MTGKLHSNVHREAKHSRPVRLATWTGKNACPPRLPTDFYWLFVMAAVPVLAAGFWLGPCSADEVKIEYSGGTVTTTSNPFGGPVAVPPGATPAVLPPGVVPASPPTPGGPPEKPDKDKKPGETPEEPGKKPPEEDLKPVTRPAKPPEEPNPDEFKIQPDAEGRFRPQFKNQSWEPVLAWLAEKSRMSLDWYPDLPGDYLNLATHRYYSVAELRSIINRDLFSRGYIMVCRGERMSILNLKNLDPSLVPRVAPEELSRLDPDQFVRVMFPLDTLLAEEVVDELEPLKGPHGKLTPLKASNRLDAMDTVANLREIDSLLRQEQSPKNQERSFQEFPLRFARAEEVRQQLIDLLGLDKPGVGAPQVPPGMNPEQMKKIMEAQQRSGKGGKPNAKLPTAQPNVSLVANTRKNSLVVSAPPDKMALIAQAINVLDVPNKVPGNLLSNVPFMRNYRIVGADPKPILKILEEIGGLSPTARVEIDRNNIIVYAPMADHLIIEKLVKQFSGSERNFEVIPLRRLDALDVAGTITYMLGKEKKKESNRRHWGWGWDDYSRNQSDDKSDEFRVDADVEHNRLLLWANEVELGEVNNLLAKLGEVTPEDEQRGPLRVIETGSVEDARKLLQRVHQSWPAPNRLEIPPASMEQPVHEGTPAEPSSNPKESAPSTDKEPPGVRSATSQPRPEFPLILVADASAEPSQSVPAAGGDRPVPSEKNPKPVPPPVKATITPSGQILITSDDPRALDLFEDLAEELVPPKSNFAFFRLKYADAYNVALILQDFFREEDKQAPLRVPYWMADEFDMSKEEKPLRLSKRRSLKFISELATNSILVQGADAKKLQEIQNVIDLYDKPSDKDDRLERRTETIHLVYSQAKIVGEAVKDVYRDLLSENDKTFQGKEGQRNSGFGDLLVTISGDGDSQSEQRSPKFKGMLSIGVDELSNTLIVSAPQFLFDDVEKLIKKLDQEAEPSAFVKVVRLPNGISSPEIQKTLAEMLGGQKTPAASTAGSHEQKSPRKKGKNSATP